MRTLRVFDDISEFALILAMVMRVDLQAATVAAVAATLKTSEKRARTMLTRMVEIGLLEARRPISQTRGSEPVQYVVSGRLAARMEAYLAATRAGEEAAAS